MSGGFTERALHLLQAGRGDDAIAELSKALAQDPSDAYAHSLMALAFGDAGRLDEALESAQRGVGEAPEWAYPHFVNAQVLLMMGAPKRALPVAEEARGLDPDDPDYYGLIAAIRCALKDWRGAASAAEEGLELDPDHDQCLNLRAMALRRLGATDEAIEALDVSLTNDPENAWTLQNLGFVKLQQGEAREAARLFREALRLDPDDAESRVGLGLAIKAQVPLYRPVLAWQMLCERLSGALGFGLILGLWLVNQAIQRSSLRGTLIGTTVLVVYLAFVWMSWAGNALADVFLLMRSDLRSILDKREKIAAIGVGAVIVLAVAALIQMYVVGDSTFGLAAGALAFASIPLAGWAPLPNGKARAVGATIAAIALVLSVASYGFTQAAWLTAPDLGSVREAIATGGGAGGRVVDRTFEDAAALAAIGAIIISVGASWLLMALGFVPERRGSRGRGRKPRA